MLNLKVVFWILLSFSFCKSVIAETILVEPSWLAERLNHNLIVVVDVRSAKAYAQGHIEGAVNIPVNSTFDVNFPDARILPIGPAKKLFGQAGIDHRVQVILYGEKYFADAARVFWVLEVYGHKKVSVLNSSFEVWMSMNYPTEKIAVKRRSREFIPKIQPERLATRFSTLLATRDASTALIDARSKDYFDGKISKTPPRSGHIPSAINIPWNRNLTGEGNSLQIDLSEKSQSLYKSISDKKHAIVYCGDGTRSVLNYLVLRNMGKDVALYDGSWLDWASDLNLPVESNNKFQSRDQLNYTNEVMGNSS